MNHLPLPYNLNELYGSQMTKFNGAFPVSHAAQRGRFLAEQTQYVSERQVDLLRMRPEEWQTCRYNTHTMAVFWTIIGFNMLQCV